MSSFNKPLFNIGDLIIFLNKVEDDEENEIRIINGINYTNHHFFTKHYSYETISVTDQQDKSIIISEIEIYNGIKNKRLQVQKVKKTEEETSTIE